ncbi:leucyl-tRNA synthetase [Cryptosporidium andersoni]|uniref:leucine--tRNA ligase n=1 Tax=Cryptosporidium andersoni TaxID=117008 RepID=A0A1J4MUW9_9CRYT|nr:leucyl-tRNA synthetase [Cryptosporidium andersoni]
MITATDESNTNGLNSTVNSNSNSRLRRDTLLHIQNEIQELWDHNKIYEANMDQSREKYMITFAFPYMNGRLHLGHAFTFTKADFQARFQRMRGRNVLFPFGFHCTGMPICASADKLKSELANNSLDNDLYMNNNEHENQLKSKVAAKIGGLKTQYEILESMGIEVSDIPKFTDPVYWTEYFPPLAMEDLKLFGAAVDWRRSFITTNINPYYDAFVKWQFRTLKYKRDKIKHGLRSAVFSRFENQPCADHDRSSGEGIGPQEYTLIKLKIHVIPEFLGSIVNGREVFVVCATLRPETMYGQTNCWVLPNGEYDLVLAFDQVIQHDTKTTDGVLCKIFDKYEDAMKKCNTVYICSERSAYNMAYQGIVPLIHGREQGVSDKLLPRIVSLGKVYGEQLIGTPLSAPLTPYSLIFILPMFSISMEKGTGIVTSVPSDSPDDYAALRDIKTKPLLRQKYSIKDEWILDPLEIIEVPGFGFMTAELLCNQYKIQSQNDSTKLKQAKEEIYKKEFYEGILIRGKYSGMKICDTKELIRESLIKDGYALIYLEPENKVVSRRGESCIIALCEQWYLNYGEETWRRIVHDWVMDQSKFRTYYPQVRTSLAEVVNWLKEWACSRSYGLGTFLPWETESDQKIVIESLSDSTIYMAYYTVAHFLQGSINGKEPGLLNIKVEDLSDELFDYIFCLTDQYPKLNNISIEKLHKMRDEFSYFYPMDCRVSGKDLIFNHLIMCLYNHVAIWDKSTMADKFWPKGFYCNGHIMVDSAKMSKSLGNWITLHDGINEFTSDACRIALADAGDTIDDANFCRDSANSAIMRLFALLQFVQMFQARKEKMRCGSEADEQSTDHNLVGKSLEQIDEIFASEIIRLIDECRKSYENFSYRDALKFSLFEFQMRRDQYRTICGGSDLDMNKFIVEAFIDIQLKILCPIAPHTCEYIWRNILKRESFLVSEEWPTLSSINGYHYCTINSKKLILLLKSIDEFRKSLDKWTSNQKKNKSCTKYVHAVVYVAKEYKQWQIEGLKVIQSIIEREGTLPKDFITKVREATEIKKMDSGDLKNTLAFLSLKVAEYKENKSALSINLPFDEFAFFSLHSKSIARILNIRELLVKATSDCKDLPFDKVSQIIPTRPAILFYCE